MSSDFTGNPTAAESPSPQPLPGNYPIVRKPSDGDALSAASVSQDFQTLADFTARLQGARPSRYQQLYNFKTPASWTSTQDPTPDVTMTATISGAGASIAIQEAGVGVTAYRGRTALVTVGGGAGQFALIGGSCKLAPFLHPANLTFFYEVDVAFATPGSANNNFVFGVQDTQNITPNNSCVFNLFGASTWNLFAQVGGASQFNVAASPASAPTANTFQRLRMVISGSATAIGVAAGNKAVATFWINDTQVGQQNFTTELGSNLYIVNGGPWFTGVGTVTVGTYTSDWDRY